MIKAPVRDKAVSATASIAEAACVTASHRIAADQPLIVRVVVSNCTGVTLPSCSWTTATP
jgi:hypothetical protein